LILKENAASQGFRPMRLRRWLRRRFCTRGLSAGSEGAIMIRRVEALNYRCLQYIDQALEDFQVLVGPNASGKTTFLDLVIRKWFS